MAKNKQSRFHKGDYVALDHSVCGIPKNMILYVCNGEKNHKGEIEVSIKNKKHIMIKTKYLITPNKNRFSSKFAIGDKGQLKRHYERFLKDSIVTVLSNYLGKNNKIVVIDERQIMGGVPESILDRIV